MTQVAQWMRFQGQFTSSKDYESPVQDVQVEVDFTSPTGRKLTTSGFWDGRGTWKARCSLSEDTGLNHQVGLTISHTPGIIISTAAERSAFLRTIATWFMQMEILKNPAVIRWFNPHTGAWSETYQIIEDSTSFNPGDNSDWIPCIGANEL